MTIKPSIAAFAAASSAVLFFGQSAYAQGFKQNVTPPFAETSTSKSLPQLQLPADYKPPKPSEPPKAPEPPAAPQTPPPSQPPAVQQVQPASQPRVYGSAGNKYFAGQCTWYVKERRPDLPNGLGNGGQWVRNAAALGLATGTTPRAGAVAEQPGHVAYVESVNGNGTINISEMNYNGGVGVVHKRTVPANAFTYIY